MRAPTSLQRRFAGGDTLAQPLFKARSLHKIHRMCAPPPFPLDCALTSPFRYGLQGRPNAAGPIVGSGDMALGDAPNGDAAGTSNGIRARVGERGHAARDVEAGVASAVPQCRKCNAPKPPRTHHCSVCRACVLRMGKPVSKRVVDLGRPAA
jgi:ribosomal protein L40E